ncbi:filamentous hemagglutinin N-terminal domain-containing protein, partial [Crocosphaera chwakensis]
MKKILKQQPSKLIALLVIGIISSSKLLNAQIVPDQTLQNNSTITIDQGVINITGGTQVGTNLFHSFKTFSFSKEMITHFNNSLAIENIFSRVTGSSISNIDGLIQVNGFANLFLINPNGIIFGPNAALNMGGSFLATTANEVVFSDGTVFGAKNNSNSVVLTVNQPIGLTFDNPQPIQIKNQGHNVNFNAFPAFNFPISGLQVFNKNLSILGGDVIFDGGILSAINGNINVGAVQSGFVSFSFIDNKLALNYDKVSHFNNIDLKNRSFINTIGLSPGSLNFYAKNLSITDGSIAMIFNVGSDFGHSLTVETTDSLTVSGKSEELNQSSFITTQTIGTGSSGKININTPRLFVNSEGIISSLTLSEGQGDDINIETQKLFVEGGGGITSAVLSTGDGGDVNIFATQEVNVSGSAPGVILSTFLPGFSNFPSSLGSFTGSTGDAGNLFIISNNLKIIDGGNVGTATFEQGNGGQVFIDVQDSIEVNGVTPLFFPSIINSAAYGDGQAGQIILNSNHLKLLDGGNI